MTIPVKEPRFVNKRKIIQHIKLLNSTTANEKSEWIDISELTDVRVQIFSLTYSETVKVYENLSFEEPATQDDVDRPEPIIERNRQGRQLQIFKLEDDTRRWLMCERGSQTSQVIVWIVGTDKRGSV